jgi:cytochrome c peroxidase
MRRASTYLLLLTVAIMAMAAALHPITPTPYKLVYPAYFGHRINLTADNPLTVEGIQLGRRLFYEKKLSKNNTLSCASCHQQSRAFTDGRRFSLGFDGTPTKRNSMTLTNILWVQNLFWDGRATSLEAQAQTPLTDAHEMGQSLEGSIQKIPEYAPLFEAAFGSPGITPDRLIKALTQFERTLISADSRYDKYIRGEVTFTASEQRGLNLFFGNRRIRSAGCSNCHGGPRTFDETYHNNGLDADPKDSGREAFTHQSYDHGRFRVVTLRNIALTAPYMHDGRFNTLQQVINHYSDHLQASRTLSPSLKDTTNTPINLHLSKQEKACLLDFLNTLTDSAFITDPRFASPF